MNKTEIQEKTIRILSNHYGFNYQEANRLVSSFETFQFLGNPNETITAFQAFCRTLTCLQTFDDHTTEEIAEKKWEEVSIEGKQQWEKVATHFPNGNLFQQKLLRIRSYLIENRTSFFSTNLDEKNNYCDKIIMGLCDLSIWIPLDIKKEKNIVTTFSLSSSSSPRSKHIFDWKFPSLKTSSSPYSINDSNSSWDESSDEEK